MNLWSLGLTFYFMGQYEAAIEQYRRAIAAEPRSVLGAPVAGLGVRTSGPCARRHRGARTGSGDWSTRHRSSRRSWHAQASAGRRAEAEATMTSLLEYAKRKYVSPVISPPPPRDSVTTPRHWPGSRRPTRSDPVGWRCGSKIDPTFDRCASDDRFRDLLTRVRSHAVTGGEQAGAHGLDARDEGRRQHRRRVSGGCPCRQVRRRGASRP